MTTSVRKALLINLTALVGLFLIVSVLRLNYPIKGMMLVEEWDLPLIIETGNPPLLGYTHTTFTTRPLLALGAFLTGYLLTPGSFVGLNFILLMSMFVSAAAVYKAIVCFLPNWRLGAFLVAALFLVHPADEYLYTLRSMANHVALAAWLVAVCLLLAYFDKPTRLRLIALWVATLISLLTYETGYPLMLATAALPLLLERRLSRRVIKVTALFGVGLALAMLISLTLYLSVPKPYVEQLLSPGGNLLGGSGFSAIAGEGVRMLRRAFYDGWRLALNRTLTLTPLPLLLLTALAVWVASQRIVRLTPSENGLRSYSWRVILAAMLVGLVIFGLGVLPYLLSVSHRVLNERIYYYASVGASLTTIMLVYLALRWLRGGRLLFGLIGGLAVGFGMVQVVGQLDNLKGYYLTQQRLLTQFAQQVPSFTAGTTVVLVDDTGQFQSIYWLINASLRLQSMLGYLYHDGSLNAVLCYPQMQVWGSEFERCSFDQAGFLRQDYLITPSAGLNIIPYANLVIFRYTADERLVMLTAVPNNDNTGTVDAPAYQPASHIQPITEPNLRVQQLLLSDVPPPVETPLDSYRLDVSGAVPPGMGWYYGSNALPDGTTWHWTSAKRVHIMLPLKVGAYTIKLRVLNLLPNEVWKTVKFAVNNTVVPTTYQLEDGGNILYTGEISASLIHPNVVNDLEIRVDDLFAVEGLTIKLGLAVDWVEVTPAN